MLVKVLNESLEVVDTFNVSFFDEVKGEAKKRIRSGSVSVGYFFRSGDIFWRVIERDGTVTFQIDQELTEKAKRVTKEKKQPTQSKDHQTPTTDEFPTISGWATFWYVCAALNFFFAFIFLLHKELGEVEKTSMFIVLVANGLLGCFFGSMTQLAWHIRWLLSEQLKELKRHDRMAENKS